MHVDIDTVMDIDLYYFVFYCRLHDKTTGPKHL